MAHVKEGEVGWQDTVVQTPKLSPLIVKWPDHALEWHLHRWFNLYD
jgi:hypothetical protein